MFYNILDTKRLKILPLLKNFKKDFYLAGGTGLALQLGHRDSLDFDFFSFVDIDTKELFLSIKKIFNAYKILKIQDEKNTLTVFIADDIKLSFFTYPYKMLEKLKNEPYFMIASILDIASMKLATVVSRASNKDYIDLYFILQKVRLKDLLKKLPKKFPELDISLVLKSLVYFEDINYEFIKFKNNQDIDFSEVKNFLQETVTNI